MSPPGAPQPGPAQPSDLAIRWGRPLAGPAAWGLLAAAAVLVVGYEVDAAWLSPLTVPAALLGPGYAVMAVAAQALERDLDPWLAWLLRILLSVAAWTVVGVLLLVVGVVPWRAVWPVTAGMALLAVLNIRRAGGLSSLRAALVALRGALRSPAVVVLVGVLGCALVAIPVATSLSRAPVPGQDYVALTIQPAGALVTGADGTVDASVTVSSRRVATGSTPVTVQLRVDGRLVSSVSLALPARGDVTLPLGARWGRCWKDAEIRLTGLDDDVAPRPLTLHNRSC